MADQDASWLIGSATPSLQTLVLGPRGHGHAACFTLSARLVVARAGVGCRGAVSDQVLAGRRGLGAEGSGTITLATDLRHQEVGFQDFVIAHELLHLRVPNHDSLVKSLCGPK